MVQVQAAGLFLLIPNPVSRIVLYPSWAAQEHGVFDATHDFEE